MILGASASIHRYHADMFAPLAIAALAFLPGDGFVSVRMTLVPQTCQIVFVDEGVTIHASGYGPASWLLMSEARLLVQDQSAQPGTLSPIEQCVRAAQATCGAAGVRSVTVTANPDSCSFECYPPSTGPKPPVIPPPANPGAGA